MKKHRKRAIIMAYKVIILYQLYMPSYFLGTFTEYPNHNGFPVSTKKRQAPGYCPESAGPSKRAGTYHGEKYNRTILTRRFSDRQIIHNRLVYLLVNWAPKQRLRLEKKAGHRSEYSGGQGSLHDKRDR